MRGHREDERGIENMIDIREGRITKENTGKKQDEREKVRGREDK